MKTSDFIPLYLQTHLSPTGLGLVPSAHVCPSLVLAIIFSVSRVPALRGFRWLWTLRAQRWTEQTQTQPWNTPQYTINAHKKPLEWVIKSCFNPHPRTCVLIFREWNIEVREEHRLVAAHSHPAGNQTHNLRVCPEGNYRTTLQPAEPNNQSQERSVLFCFVFKSILAG